MADGLDPSTYHKGAYISVPESEIPKLIEAEVLFEVHGYKRNMVNIMVKDGMD